MGQVPVDVNKKDNIKLNVHFTEENRQMINRRYVHCVLVK